jgi:hypothetical protein
MVIDKMISQKQCSPPRWINETILTDCIPFNTLPMFKQSGQGVIQKVLDARKNTRFLFCCRSSLVVL